MHDYYRASAFLVIFRLGFCLGWNIACHFNFYSILLWLFAVPRYTESEIIGIGILISKQAGTPYYIVPMRAADAKHAVHIIREIAKINK